MFFQFLAVLISGLIYKDWQISVEYMEGIFFDCEMGLFDLIEPPVLFFGRICILLCTQLCTFILPFRGQGFPLHLYQYLFRWYLIMLDLYSSTVQTEKIPHRLYKEHNHPVIALDILNMALDHLGLHEKQMIPLFPWTT